MTGMDIALIAGIGVGLLAQLVFYAVWFPEMDRTSWTSRWILALNGCITAILVLALAPRFGVDTDSVAWQVLRLLILVVLVGGVLVGQVFLLFRARRNGRQ